MERNFILALAAVVSAHPGLAQTVTVQPSAVPGVEILGPLSSGYASYVDQVLLPPRSPALNAWLPFGVVLKNGTTQSIVGVALRWNGTLANGSVSSGTLMSLSEAPRRQIAPGQVAVALPTLEEVRVQGDTSDLPARLRLNPAPEYAGTRDEDLANYQSARSVEVVLDGVVFASGQFMGPDTELEYERWVADRTVPGQVAAKVLAMKAAGDPIESIAAWLQQTAKSEGAADPTMDATGTAARRLLQTYQRQGEAAFYQRLQMNSQPATIHIFR